MRRQLFTSALFGCFLFIGQAAAGPEVHEGQWEITTQMIITGMPFHPKPVTRTQCVTKKDPVPRPSEDRGKCEVSTVKGDGNKWSYHVVCVKSANDKAEGNGEITYSGDTMEGSATFKITNPRAPQSVEASQTIKGRRLGDCPPK
jgi:hypothetical protein